MFEFPFSFSLILSLFLSPLPSSFYTNKRKSNWYFIARIRSLHLGWLGFVRGWARRERGEGEDKLAHAFAERARKFEDK